MNWSIVPKEDLYEKKILCIFKFEAKEQPRQQQQQQQQQQQRQIPSKLNIETVRLISSIVP